MKRQVSPVPKFTNALPASVATQAAAHGHLQLAGRAPMCRPPGGSSGGGGLSQTSQETKLEEGAWGETDLGGVVQTCPQPMGLYWGLPKSLYKLQI